MKLGLHKLKFKGAHAVLREGKEEKENLLD